MEGESQAPSQYDPLGDSWDLGIIFRQRFWIVGSVIDSYSHMGLIVCFIPHLRLKLI